MKRRKTLVNDITWNKINLNDEKQYNEDSVLITSLLSSIISKKQLPLVVDKLLNEFSNLNDLLHADKDKLLSIVGIKEPIYRTFAVVRELLARSLSEQIVKRNVISCWKELLNYLKFTMGTLKIEHFRILFLNSKNVLLADEVLATGTINHTPVYIREIVRRILFHEAASIVLIHNHPSGDPTPSIIDMNLTAKIIDACKTVEVKVLDHIIISRNKYFSFNKNFKTGVDISSYNFNSANLEITEKI